MTSSVYKKHVLAFIISRWLSPNPSASERKSCFAAWEQQQEIYCQHWSIVSQTLGLSPDDMQQHSSALASPQWEMGRVFVLREQFKCWVTEKEAAPAHHQQMWIFFFFSVFFQDVTDCRSALISRDSHVKGSMSHIPPASRKYEALQ